MLPMIIKPHRNFLHLDIYSIWDYRELFFFFVWRDIKVRYKQTIIGASWSIIQPFMSMVIFTIVFGYFAKMPSDNLPYPIFTYTAMLPWHYFAQALSRSSASLVGSANLITKVYFPRLIIPVSGTIVPLVDFAIAFTILVGMMIWFDISPSWNIIILPLFLLLAWLTALTVGLWLSALHVKYRDVGHTVPFLIQLWMYASPVVYPVSMVPERWRLLYSLNPMSGVIEGFRWALLGNNSPDFLIITVSSTIVLMLFFSAIIFFQYMERTFADFI